MCYSVAAAIYISGNLPLYLDASIDGICVDWSLNKHQLARCGAVLCVHSYGVINNIGSLRKICDELCLPLIEDCAVAQASRYDSGEPVGSAGDICILSFGAGKIISAGHGGALLTSDQDIALNANMHTQRLSISNKRSAFKVDRLSSYHTSLYNSLFLGGSYSEIPARFKGMCLEVTRRAISAFDPEYLPTLGDLLADLEEVSQVHLKNFNSHRERLFGYIKSGYVSCMDLPDGSVPWRFNLTLPNRDRYLKKLLTQRKPISSWYPPVDMFFSRREKSMVSTPNIDTYASTVINLWVNNTVREDYFEFIEKSIAEHLSSPG